MSSENNGQTQEFKVLELGEIQDTKLLCSLLYPDGKELQDFTLKALTRKDLKVLKNETLAKQRPLQWLKTAVETVVDNFDGAAPKSVVSHLSLNDMMYILYRSHLKNFGNILPDVKYNCPHCYQDSVVQLDLNKVLVDYPTDKCYSTDTFDFIPDDKIEISFKDSTFVVRKIVFRHVVFGDSIKYESSFKPNQQSTYVEQVYSDCCVSIECEDGTVFDSSQAKMICFNIINNKLSVKDSSKLEGHFSKRPGVRNYISVECPACSMIADFRSPFFYLFPQKL